VNSINENTVPSLDDPCGANFVYRHLIECGDTVANSGVDNSPQSPDSYTALRSLAVNILDPVIDRFGTIELTYGFCSSNLKKLITKRIAPDLDQHAAHEMNRTGKHICNRLGAAVDFLVRNEDMFEVAEWVYSKTPIDRLYFYDSNKPIHVSHGPQNSHVAYELKLSPGGKRVPRKLKL
jgi:hypothetical protein